MGLKIGTQILKQTKIAIKHCTSPNVNGTVLSLTQIVGDISECVVTPPKIFKPLTKKEIVSIKPSEFENLVSTRTDIPECLRITGNCFQKAKIHSPEQLSLYDEINNILLEKMIDSKTRTVILSNILEASPSRCEITKKTLTKLIQKGYDVEILSQLNITEQNYKHIEKVIKKTARIRKKLDEIVDASVNHKIKLLKSMRMTLTDERVMGIKEEFLNESIKWEKDFLKKLCNEINDSNIKYLDDWFKYIDSKPMEGNCRGLSQLEIDLLAYWNKDSLKILNEFSGYEEGSKRAILEVVSRRGHDFSSVKRIFGDKKITTGTISLLEFKDLSKFENIDLTNFHTLSIEDKKEFINSFISVLSPRKIGALNEEALSLMKEKVKIFNLIDTTSRESIKESRSKILKDMLESISKSEREIIKTKANWGQFHKMYRKQNPIPALVDDLEKLPYRTEIINGKRYLVSEIPENTDLRISAHCTGAKDFLTLQALEITDPEEILCVGTNGLGKLVHYNKDGYSLAIKPRLGEDFWMQLWTDFDSGSGATKNVKEVGNKFKLREDYHAYIPNLLKKFLNLSQLEYTRRLKTVANCTTLDEIGKIDSELEQAIRSVLKENAMFEGILRPEPMAVLISKEKPLSEISQEVLDYVDFRKIRLIQVTS